jgi:hypothetical protein
MPVRAVLVTAVLALAAPAAGASAAAPDRASSSCPKSGTIARISGKRTCLATGRACAASKQRQYKKNGYTCSKGRLKKVSQSF